MNELIASHPSSTWTDQQRANFYYQMAAVQKDEVLGVVLAVFLGSFGAHHFYLRRNGLAILYCIFFWTGIPGLIALIEAFFMPGRVRQYNAAQAAYIVAAVQGNTTLNIVSVAIPPVAVCAACGAPVSAGARYCVRCGAALSA